MVGLSKCLHIMEKGQLAIVLLLCLVARSLAKPAYKHLAGGPSEFLPPPDPSSAGVESHIRLLEPATLQASSGLRYNDETFLVDSRDFTFVVLCSSESNVNSLDAIFTSPSGSIAEATEISEGPFGLGGRTYPSKAWYFSRVEFGEWSVRLVLTETASTGDVPINVFSFVTFADGDSPVSVTASLGTLNTLLGDTVELRAVVVDPALPAASGNGTDRVGRARVETAELVVRHPSGKVRVRLSECRMVYGGWRGKLGMVKWSKN